MFGFFFEEKFIWLLRGCKDDSLFDEKTVVLLCNLMSSWLWCGELWWLWADLFMTFLLVNWNWIFIHDLLPSLRFFIEFSYKMIAVARVSALAANFLHNKFTKKNYKRIHHMLRHINFMVSFLFMKHLISKMCFK